MENANFAFKYLCCYCKKLLRTPIQTNCGHRFCRACLENILSRENNSYCQACSEEEDGNASMLSREEIFSDKAILRELKVISLSCQNIGCEWKGSYQEYDQEHADHCPMERIKCINTGCEVLVFRGDLVDHLNRSCDMRVVQCPHCTSTLPYKNIQKHTEDCERAPTECRYCKREDIPKGRLAEHQHIESGDCERRMVPCKYDQIGCKEMAEVRGFDEHSNQYTTEHLELLRETLLPMMDMVNEAGDFSRQEEALKEAIAKHQDHLDKMTTLSAHIKTEIAKINAAAQTKQQTALPGQLKSNLEEKEKLVQGLTARAKVIETKLSTCEGVVNELHRRLEQNAKAFKSLETQQRRDREMIEALERKIRAQERTMNLKDETLAEHHLRVQSLELASYDGISVWKISDFSRKRSEAISGKTTSFYSPCFFSSRHGYKMCTRVYLNGDGMGKGSHVSLFFTILRGPFDALLRWPFRQKVTFMWVDQNDREHVVDAFRPDPTSSSFKRPTQDMNVASGCPLFMPLSLLDSPRHAFAKDDVAFLKIIVDTTDIA